jgi:threonylcarbamoyladenosine tRNA methylthiotransferase MtaB
VTNEAVRQTRQAIRRAKRERPDARIVVTGCAAQLEPGDVRGMPEVAGWSAMREVRGLSSFQRAACRERLGTVSLE